MPSAHDIRPYDNVERSENNILRRQRYRIGNIFLVYKTYRMRMYYNTIIVL